MGPNQHRVSFLLFIGLSWAAVGNHRAWAGLLAFKLVDGREFPMSAVAVRSSSWETIISPLLGALP
jgi:hypothetical protein